MNWQSENEESKYNKKTKLNQEQSNESILQNSQQEQEGQMPAAGIFMNIQEKQRVEEQGVLLVNQYLPQQPEAISPLRFLRNVLSWLKVQNNLNELIESLTEFIQHHEQRHLQQQQQKQQIIKIEDEFEIKEFITKSVQFHKNVKFFTICINKIKLLLECTKNLKTEIQNQSKQVGKIIHSYLKEKNQEQFTLQNLDYDTFQQDGNLNQKNQNIEQLLQTIRQASEQSEYNVVFFLLEDPVEMTQKEIIEGLLNINIIIIVIHNDSQTIKKITSEIKSLVITKKKQNQYGEIIIQQDKLPQDTHDVVMRKLNHIMNVNTRSKTNKLDILMSNTVQDEIIDTPETFISQILTKQMQVTVSNFFKNLDVELDKGIKVFKGYTLELRQEGQEDINQITINHKLDETISWNSVISARIATGSDKNAYLMKKKDQFENDMYIIKTSKDQLFTDMKEIKKSCFSHLIAKDLMQKFQQNLKNFPGITYPIFEFSNILILEEQNNGQSRFWIAEKFFIGDFIKYNNNFGYINEDKKSEINLHAQAFSLFTFYHSNKKYMINDIQGVQNKENQIIYLTDPAIVTSQENPYNQTDTMIRGQRRYFDQLSSQEFKIDELFQRFGVNIQ